jgi:hypothetical protein
MCRIEGLFFAVWTLKLVCALQPDGVVAVVNPMPDLLSGLAPTSPSAFFIHSVSNVPKKDSATALSQHSSFRLIDTSIWYFSDSAQYNGLVWMSRN